MAKLTQARLHEFLNYDPDTGLFTWRMQRAYRFKIGDRAGTSWNGYILIGVDGIRYKGHRLAWLYVHGEWPDGNLDHIDCDRSNNRIANLRLATRTQNGGNSRKSKRNTSGFKGVSWNKDTGRWMANIQFNARPTYLGLFDTREAAHAAYCEAAQKHFGEFARFE